MIVKQIREIEDAPLNVRMSPGDISENAASRWASQRESEMLEQADAMVSAKESQVVGKKVTKITKTQYNTAEKKAMAYI